MPLKGIPYLTRAQLPSSLKAAGVEFDVLAPYSGCFLCGEVYQSPYDILYLEMSEDPFTPLHKLHDVKAKADALRFAWRSAHSNSHTTEDHERLAESKDLMTPEAAMALAPLGVIPLDGSNEVMQALAEAPRVPAGRIREGRLRTCL